VEPIPIDDPLDPRLADYATEDPRTRRRDIERAAVAGGFLICEGPLVVRRLLQSRARIRSLLLTPTRLAGLRDVIDQVEAPVYLAPPAIVEQAVGYSFHRGALAAADRPAQPPLDELLAGARVVAVVEDVVDHENLGSIFRNAAAFGVDAVLMSPRTCDPYYRRCVRVSVGHVLTLPHGRLEPWPGGLQRVAEAGFTLAALTPDEDATPIESFRPDGPVALLLGTEGPGLTDGAFAHAPAQVRIPMAGEVDSINVAAASAVAFYELTRQTAPRP
jgi:tRNA G18 (ribose-2'-O)-methylase SpoU